MAAGLADQLAQQPSAQTRELLRVLVTRIDMRSDKVEIHLLPERIGSILAGNASALSPATAVVEAAPTLTISAAARLKRTGMEMKMLIESSHARKGKPDPSLVKLIVKAQQLKEQFIPGGKSLGSLADSAGVSRSYFTRLVKLAFLAPDITETILDGRNPPDLTASRLINHIRLPLDWKPTHGTGVYLTPRRRRQTRPIGSHQGTPFLRKSRAGDIDLKDATERSPVRTVPPKWPTEIFAHKSAWVRHHGVSRGSWRMRSAP